MVEWKKIIQKAGPFRIGLVIVCGVVLLLLSLPGSSEKTVQVETTREKEETTLNEYKRNMENELKKILSQVTGVGKVEVMITLKGSNEKVTLKDNHIRGTENEEETVLIEDSDNNSLPYVVQEKEPEIEGVVVVCDGGDNSLVKREITDAIFALFHLESHKIKVMKAKEVNA